MTQLSLAECFFIVVTLPIIVPITVTMVAIDYTIEAVNKLKKLVYENGYGMIWERIQRILERRLEKFKNICVEAFIKFIEDVIKRGCKMLDAIQMVEENGRIPNINDIPHVD